MKKCINTSGASVYRKFRISATFNMIDNQSFKSIKMAKLQSCNTV